MLWKWFKDCKTAEDGKKRYHQLSREYHPDNGGDAETMKHINAEFSDWWKRFKDIHTSAKGTTYKAEKETTETAEMFMDIIDKLSHLHDIDVEICGSWLWLSGNTYGYREELKSFGCRWSQGKKKWYWTVEPFIRKKSRMTMEDIRRVYGSEHVHMHRNPELDG